MRLQNTCAGLLAVATAAGAMLAPLGARAQGEYHHRQQTKNTWRNLAIGSGALGLLGLLKHDDTLTFAGGAGALYSYYRYDQDRKSQNRMRRARAQMFSRRHYTRNGHRYERRTVYRHGQRYYQFVRVD